MPTLQDLLLGGGLEGIDEGVDGTGLAALAGGDIDTDMLSQLLMSQAMDQAQQPVETDGTMAFASTLMKSPYYAGQPSFSGAGQISEAIMPLVVGLLAEQSAERKAREAAKANFVKALMSVAQLKKAGLDTELKQRELTLKDKEISAKDRELAQGQAYAEMLLDPSQRGNLQLSGGTVDAKGGKLTFDDPALAKNSGSHAIADALRGMNNQAPGITHTYDAKAKQIVTTDNNTGEVFVRPAPDTKAMTEASKNYSQLVATDGLLSMYEKTIADADPATIGNAGAWGQMIGGLSESVAGIATQTATRLTSGKAPGQIDPEYTKYRDSWWYKSLTNPSPNADREQVLYAGLVYEVARGIAGQEGRAMSEGDIAQIEQMLPARGLTKADKLYKIASLRDMVKSRQEMALANATAIFDPAAGAMHGALGMESRMPTPGVHSVPEAKKMVEEWYRLTGVRDKQALSQLVAYTLLRRGYSTRPAE